MGGIHHTGSGDYWLGLWYTDDGDSGSWVFSDWVSHYFSGPWNSTGWLHAVRLVNGAGEDVTARIMANEEQRENCLDCM